MGENASLCSGNYDGKSIKERLEDLRKLLAEEDINETVKGIQNDWELEDQKILHGKHNLKKHIQEAAPINDLTGYLTTKIQQVQERCHFEDLEKEKFAGVAPRKREAPSLENSNIFKASTLTHIAELRRHGQEKIENQFIERVYKEQTGYHYEQFSLKQ